MVKYTPAYRGATNKTSAIARMRAFRELGYKSIVRKQGKKYRTMIKLK